MAMQSHWGEHYINARYHPPSYQFKKYFRKLKRKLGLPSAYAYQIDDWYDRALDTVIRNLADKIDFDTVIIEYVFLSKALTCFGNDVLKLIDTHDVFTNRHQRYLDQGERPNWFSTTQREEARGLNRADAIIAIQNKEAEFFRSMTHRDVITVGHFVPSFPPQSDPQPGNRILFIGSDNAINVKACEYLVKEIFPSVLAEFPQAELAIGGRLCNVIEGQPGIVKLGELDDLKPAYESATIVVNPMPFGTGLKIKTIEALGYAKPLVTTPSGADGLDDGVDNAFIVAATTEEFIQAIIDLLNSDITRQTLKHNAHQYAENWNRKCLFELENLLS